MSPNSLFLIKSSPGNFGSAIYGTGYVVHEFAKLLGMASGMERFFFCEVSLSGLALALNICDTNIFCCLQSREIHCFISVNEKLKSMNNFAKDTAGIDIIFYYLMFHILK